EGSHVTELDAQGNTRDNEDNDFAPLDPDRGDALGATAALTPGSARFGGANAFGQSFDLVHVASRTRADGNAVDLGLWFDEGVIKPLPKLGDLWARLPFALTVAAVVATATIAVRRRRRRGLDEGEPVGA